MPIADVGSIPLFAGFEQWLCHSTSPQNEEKRCTGHKSAPDASLTITGLRLKAVIFPATTFLKGTGVCLTAHFELYRLNIVDEGMLPFMD
jgi:hypothetical protein